MFNKNLFLTLALLLQVFGLVSGDAPQPGTPVGQGIVAQVPNAPVRVGRDLRQDLGNNPVVQALFADDQVINGANRQALQEQIDQIQFEILQTIGNIEFANNQELAGFQAQLVRLHTQLANLQGQLVA